MIAIDCDNKRIGIAHKMQIWSETHLRNIRMYQEL